MDDAPRDLPYPRPAGCVCRLPPRARAPDARYRLRPRARAAWWPKWTEPRSPRRSWRSGWETASPASARTSTRSGARPSTRSSTTVCWRPRRRSAASRSRTCCRTRWTARSRSPTRRWWTRIYEQNRARFAGPPAGSGAGRHPHASKKRERQARRAGVRPRIAGEGLGQGRARAAPRPPSPCRQARPAWARRAHPSRSCSSWTTSARTATGPSRTIDEILSRYPGKVQLVHRDFPLEGHPEAMPAARAARCAGEQGKFWDYHRSLMMHEGQRWTTHDLKARAPRR